MAVADQSVATNLYRIEEQIGAGGMGTVYRALDVQLHRRVALKVLNSGEPALLDRFLREQEITAELDHPCFVRILSIGYLDRPEGSLPFFTMPLIRGLTLEQIVTRRRLHGPEGQRLRTEFTQARLLQLMHQICLTLQSAHDKRIIHRDLKPANVIVGPYGEIYVTDLGLAKRLGPRSGETARFEIHVMKQLARAEESDLTQGAVLGTPYYMAPEQGLDPTMVDHRADIFGLGAILYYILTGRRPVYLEPANRPEDWARRTNEIAQDLRRRGVDPQVPPRDLPPEIRGLLETYEEALGMVSDNPYHVFRARMRHGTIVPPRQALAQAAPPEKRSPDSEAADPIDDALQAVCMKALAKDPAERYSSCRAMAQELQQYMEGRTAPILKRRGLELTRHPSKSTTEVALQHYDQAERALREVISRHEDLGRMGIEDRLELFDVLLGKARIHEARGDLEAIFSLTTRAEPLIESTLAVLERQFIQIAIFKGIALYGRGGLEEAKDAESRAQELAEARGHLDLAVVARIYYGLACVRVHSRTGSPDDLARGRQALEGVRRLAQSLGDTPSEIRGLTALADLTSEGGEGDREAEDLLGEALRLAGEDPILLCLVHTALGTRRMRRGNPSAAVEHGLEAVRHATEGDSQASLQEAHLLLGQAYHFLGHPEKSREAFRAILGSLAGRNTHVAQEIHRFCERNHVDLRERT